MDHALEFLAVFVVVVVIANVLVRRRQVARRTSTADFALERGLVPAGDQNPLLAAFRVPEVPTFLLAPRPRFVIGQKLIEFDGAPDLARRFMITTDDEDALRRSFTPAVLAACEALPTDKQWPMSAGGEWLFATFGLAQADDLGLLLDASEGVASALQASSGAVAGTL